MNRRTRILTDPVLALSSCSHISCVRLYSKQHMSTEASPTNWTKENLSKGRCKH